MRSYNKGYNGFPIFRVTPDTLFFQVVPSNGTCYQGVDGGEQKQKGLEIIADQKVAKPFYYFT